MKIVFHENFKRSDYVSNGASAPGRMESIMTALREDGYLVVSPKPASYDDLLLAHSETHIADIQKDKKLFEMACLSAGGAILAAKMAFNMDPAFACIRPPGPSRIKKYDLGLLCVLQYGPRSFEIESGGTYKKRVCSGFRCTYRGRKY